MPSGPGVAGRTRLSGMGAELRSRRDHDLLTGLQCRSLPGFPVRGGGHCRPVKDRFQLRERLGVGGTAVVWRARDEILERDVALKVLSVTAAPDPAKRERFRLEARAAAGLRHPHIVEIFDYGEAPGMPGEAPVPYVVMELVDGRTLSDLLADGPLPWRTAATICSQVAAALAAAHAAGVVHRDVKPGNVMVTADGAKLVDFGISASAGSADETGGELLGTPAYLAPERLDGGPVRPASDVYGVGLLLYRALAGRMPWQAASLTEVVRAHLHAEPGPLPSIDGLPRAVTDVLRRCLAKCPDDRPTAAEVAGILDDAATRRRRAPSIRIRPLKAAPAVAATRPMIGASVGAVAVGERRALASPRYERVAVTARRRAGDRAVPAAGARTSAITSPVRTGRGPSITQTRPMEMSGALIASGGPADRDATRTRRPRTARRHLVSATAVALALAAALLLGSGPATYPVRDQVAPAAATEPGR
jgi:hypothetical protein